MPVNLIILEQGEGMGNRTTAVRAAEAKTRAAMVAEHNSFLFQTNLSIFLSDLLWILFFGSAAETADASCVVADEIIGPNRREACTESNIILR